MKNNPVKDRTPDTFRIVSPPKWKRDNAILGRKEAFKEEDFGDKKKSNNK